MPELTHSDKKGENGRLTRFFLDLRFEDLGAMAGFLGSEDVAKR